jgi:hypothetical protein
MALVVIQIWIVFSAVLMAGGWLLSFLHIFNGAGFALLVGLTMIWALWFCRRALSRSPRLLEKAWANWRCEIRKPLPCLFYVLAGLSLVSGLLYSPTNPDALSYRIPRLLNWAAEQRWHWITAPDLRMNGPAPGGDFMEAPLLFLTKSYDLFFIYNWISFLLLPYSLYTLFIRFKVRPRVAWHWMWIVPSGYCYVLQASSVANDAFPTIYALAAIDFAFRARLQGRLGFAFLSMLAMASATGAKQTNALLGLPWLIAFAPNWRLLARKPFLTLLVTLFSIFASMIPISWLNMENIGVWTGFPGKHSLSPVSPIWGIVGNAVALPAQNLQPPICPGIKDWNLLAFKIRSTEFGKHFEGFELWGSLYKTQNEQSCGLGMVLCGLLLLTIWAGRKSRGLFPEKKTAQIALMGLSSWVVLLIAMAKLGSAVNARYLAPLYPLLIAQALSGRRNVIVTRQKWWRLAAVCAMFSAVVVVLISRQRPLFPAETITRSLAQKFPANRLALAARDAFAHFSQIEELTEFVRKQIPENEALIGYVVDVGLLEPAMWKPLWTRRVVRVTRNDTWASLRARGIRFVVLDPTAFTDPRYDLLGRNWLDIEHWSRRFPCDVLAARRLRYSPNPEQPPRSVYVLRLKDNPGFSPSTPQSPPLSFHQSHGPQTN